MIWQLQTLMESAAMAQTKRNGQWVPSRPFPAPWILRVKAAWIVYRGRADAVVWPDGQ